MAEIMKRLILACVALSFVFVAAGCGQSGPLYVPGNPSRISNPPPPADETEEGEEGEEGEDENDSEKK